MKTYMFAISFDLEISELKKHYGEPYNNAYFEIKEELKKFDFDWVQGSLYLSEKNLANLFQALNHLKTIDWFKKSVRDVRAFKVEDWSDFTNIIKEG